MSCGSFSHLGCNSDVCDVVSWESGSFFIFATIKHDVSLAVWAIVCVYGPADHSRAADFLGEIQALVGAKQVGAIPIILGGDFNLIRFGADKNKSTGLGSRCSITSLPRLRFGKLHGPVLDTLGLTRSYPRA